MKVKVEIKNFLTKLEKDINNITNLKKAFFDISVYLQRKVHETFTKEGARDGLPRWKPFSKNTLRPGSKRPSGAFYTESSKLLQDTGNTRNSFRIQKLNDIFLVFGSDLKNAEKHQNGYGVPARPMFQVLNSDMKNIDKRFQYWTNKNIEDTAKHV